MSHTNRRKSLRGFPRQWDKIKQHQLWVTKNKWESAGLMDGYYVVGVIVIPYPRFGVIINIVSKKDNAYHVIIGNIP